MLRGEHPRHFRPRRSPSSPLAAGSWCDLRMAAAGLGPRPRGRAPRTFERPPRRYAYAGFGGRSVCLPRGPNGKPPRCEPDTPHSIARRAALQASSAAGLTSSNLEAQAGYSSVGKASDCKALQRSDGLWFDSGRPDMSRMLLAHAKPMLCQGSHTRREDVLKRKHACAKIALSRRRQPSSQPSGRPSARKAIASGFTSWLSSIISG
jgi:hypothetical protein